jgi:hypothetical protein
LTGELIIFAGINYIYISASLSTPAKRRSRRRRQEEE